MTTAIPAARPRRAALTRWLVGTAVAAPVLALAMYLWNPLHARTLDPRGRILGVVPYHDGSIGMEPAIPAGSLLLACTSARGGIVPARGDVIVFRPPGGDVSPQAKRVVALAGDRVEFRGHVLRLNGIPLHEPHVLAAGESQEDFLSVVPPGHVFVAGDNRGHSYDSRHYGPVALRAILGRVCATF